MTHSTRSARSGQASVTGTLYENKTMVFNDDNRLTSISYGDSTDLYTYNPSGSRWDPTGSQRDWQGLRTRTRLNGQWRRYLYNGERVLQSLTDDGEWHTTYTTENGSYEGTLVGIKRYDLEQERFPLYDNIGTALGLVCELGTVTDSYDMDTRQRRASLRRRARQHRHHAQPLQIWRGLGLHH